MNTRSDLEMSYREIANVLGLSHSRIQQIERVALAKLAKAYGAKLVGKPPNGGSKENAPYHCSRCGQRGHNARSKKCEGKL